NADMKKVKEALLPYLQKFGLNGGNIHFENGTVEIDLPVLKNTKAVEQSLKETTKAETLTNETKEEAQEPIKELEAKRDNEIKE
ncbi:hypothetical protein, partial [Listeria monocytogenes]|uniref:hypothetical protein n=1 Tax=Listeria monocytogenes TaxID=1639 RepID=UPI002FDBAEC3